MRGGKVEVMEGEGDQGPSLTAHLDYGQRLLEAAGLQREGDSWRGQAADGADIESDTASLAGIVRTGCVRGDVHGWLATFLKDLVSGAP